MAKVTKKTAKSLFQATKNIHKGGLHESMGVPKGQKIPLGRIKKAASARKDSLKREQAQLALNMMGKKK